MTDLRAAIEALAEEWERRADEGASAPRHKRPEWIPALRSRAADLRKALAAPAPDTDALAERVTVLGQVVEVPESEHYANGWEAGVRQAVDWLRGGYEYGTGPQWREDGCEWILGCLAATNTPAHIARTTGGDR